MEYKEKDWTPEIGDTSSIYAPFKFINVGSEKIAYKIIGDGKPVIFLHRFRGTLNDWDPAFVDTIAKDHKVILFDPLGVGLSSGAVLLSVTKWAEQAVHFAHALGITRATYLGWSMGGAVAQVIAINHPDSVDKIVLLATGPSGNPDMVPGNPEFGVRARKPVYDFEDNQFLFFHSSETSKAACASYLKRVSMIKERDTDTKPESYQNMSAAMADFKNNKEKDYFSELKNIKKPVLIANGKFDPSYPLMNSCVLEREIPNSKLIVYPDAGHGFLFQHYEQFTPELLTFLASN